jgi:hypothetical protein
MGEVMKIKHQEFTVKPSSTLIFSSPWCSSLRKVLSSACAFLCESGDSVASGICDIRTNTAMYSLQHVFTWVPCKNGEQVKTHLGARTEKQLLSAVKEGLCR